MVFGRFAIYSPKMADIALRLCLSTFASNKTWNTHVLKSELLLEWLKSLCTEYNAYTRANIRWWRPSKPIEKRCFNGTLCRGSDLKAFGNKSEIAEQCTTCSIRSSTFASLQNKHRIESRICHLLPVCQPLNWKPTHAICTLGGETFRHTFQMLGGNSG